MKHIYDNITKHISKILLVISSIILYIILLLGSQDNDMFFEIMSGHDLLNGNFETASHLNNFPIIVQQWLYSVCLAIFDKLEYFGDILFVFIQNLLLWIVSSIFIYKKIKNKKISIIAPFFIIVFCSEYMINIRPQIITMILLVTELIFIDIYHQKHNIKYLLPIFSLLILAANFHQAVFLYHIFILVPYYINKKSKLSIDWKLVIITPLFILCSLITPYGLNGSLYIIRTFQSKIYDIINISELNQIPIISLYGFKLLLLVILTIYYIYKHQSNIYINFYVFSVVILSLINARHISIMYLPSLILICYIDFSKINKFKNIFIQYGFILFFSISFIHINQAIDLKTTYGQVATIIENKNANIYNTALDLGGYLEYNGYTNISLDSRIEAFSKEISGIEGIPEEYTLLKYGYHVNNQKYSIASYEDILNAANKYDYIISKKNDFVNRVVENTWNKIFEDSTYIIWGNLTQ